LRIGNASWLTYHANNARTGVDKTIQSFGSVRLAWKSTPFDGAIYAEPLVIGDTVIAATENNSIYSVDAGSGNVVWRTNLGEPVPRSDLPCGNIDPTGITGTPSIDLASKTVYVVGFLRPPHHELFALNLRNGSVRFHHSADPATSDPLVQQQRGALTVANGFVYVPYGGLLGDCGAYYGWIVGMRTDGTGKLVDFKVPTGRAGGIWAPSGAAVDESGNLFVATGNSYSTDNFDFGESVIKLSPSLKLADWFAPSDWSSLNADDRDLGSVGPTFLDSTTLFQIGKEGMGYLLNPERLGMIGGQQFSAKVCNAAFGGTAYSQPLLFVPCVDGLVALSVKLGSSPSFNVAWRGPAFNAGPPIVAGGAVWTVDIAGGTLYSLSLGDGHVLFKSSLGGVAHFCTPASGGRRVYVAANDQVIAFALNP
jgi:outer membrane protein assembly factor BamB